MVMKRGEESDEESIFRMNEGADRAEGGLDRQAGRQTGKGKR
jgi:hypothetical protein